MGGEDGWDWLEGRWAAETRHLKAPFRSTECECQQGQFKKWPKSDCDALMATLVGVIHECKLYGFASIVPVQAYRRAFHGAGKRDAFFLAVTQTVMNMAHIANQINQDVALWFEDGPAAGRTVNIFHSVKKMNWKPAKRLRSITLDSKELRPLQSADLVAREAFKHIQNLGVRPTRKPIIQMRDVLYFIEWSVPALEYLAQNGGPANLQLLSEWDSRKDAPHLHMFWKRF